MNILIETLEMMGFTFLVGFGVAVVIKLMVWGYTALTKDSIMQAITDLETQVARQRIYQKKLTKKFHQMETVNSDIELIQLVAENKNIETSEENVDDFYALFNYYRSASKDNPESDGTNELIQHYYGKI